MTHILIHYPETADGKPYQVSADDQAHFLATFNRALAWTNGGDSEVRNVEIYIRDRTKQKVAAGGQVYDEGGWLEHAIVVNYPNNRRMVIGAIQRTVGADSEFHS